MFYERTFSTLNRIVINKKKRNEILLIHQQGEWKVLKSNLSKKVLLTKTLTILKSSLDKLNKSKDKMTKFKLRIIPEYNPFRSCTSSNLHFVWSATFERIPWSSSDRATEKRGCPKQSNTVWKVNRGFSSQANNNQEEG